MFMVGDKNRLALLLDLDWRRRRTGRQYGSLNTRLVSQGRKVRSMAPVLHRRQSRDNLNSLVASNLCPDQSLQKAIESPRRDAWA
jgi:hypothetical protein